MSARMAGLAPAASDRSACLRVAANRIKCIDPGPAMLGRGKVKRNAAQALSDVVADKPIAALIAAIYNGNGVVLVHVAEHKKLMSQQIHL